MTSSKNGLKAITIIEAFKGLLSLLVGFGLHALAGQNLEQVAENLVRHTHLNPASHFPHIFIHAASSVSSTNISLIIIGAFAYSVIRFIEAYGLWKGFIWTEWFALLTGAIYLPFEIYEMLYHPHIVSVGVFFLNLVVVGYMANLLQNKRKTRNESHMKIENI
ncbi:DUF2127 domain-containing protein [Marinomonas profundimaris]|uniref:Membrane protein n=1 Tax=Marinomonas profundimaris TaxID=1208321 RepID=W1S021_9GAMM|nr:DUF2127 domain-containing protein [Marinomonas profundimaris]ETI62567.1 membrane protein [Marinomonas profundimaris]